ncbi:LacI family transcriptional regulator [Jatrophihabitans telluris]|uniref:LacI family transcriptional regulator n=1 Tax=Jatrophihabitans telluris TaxID=2038343 RepID=A0ABY4R7D5_9ACTN|nr:LacI family DNA-binding transcriptional regulator [Jatrophihabitans telluris]UQX90324.1 LacI family transcriptional regulator [Jatrophihabitans telluris]
MRDVAMAAQVSISTVSHVLNGTRFVDPATETRVRAVIEQLGYRHNHLARAVARGGRSQSIGVGVSAWTNPYFGAVVSAIDSAVADFGSTLLLGETGEDEEREYRLVTSLLERRVDGIVLAPGPRSAERTLPMLEAAKTPTVLLDRIYPAAKLDQVGTDNIEPTASLVDHLAQTHGKLRIGLVSGLPGLSTTHERLLGYQTGLQRNGIAFDPTLVGDGGSSVEQGEQAAARMLATEDPPTAIIAGNNEMSVGTLRWLRTNRLSVPDDVAFCGFDDFDWAELMTSPITAIAQDWPRIGLRAVSLLRARLEDTTLPYSIDRLPASLIIRNSCGCP